MNDQSGFTLLEVLVALVVFGFLLLGLGRGVEFGLQAWTRQDRGIAARSELDAVDRTLRTLVTRLDPARPVTGTAHGVAFTSDLPQTAALATHEADMAIGVDGARRMTLRWTPHLHARRLTPAPAAQDAELLRGLLRLDIAYWAPGGWTDSWSAQDPPALIRFRVLFPPNDPRHWADIVTGPLRSRPDR